VFIDADNGLVQVLVPGIVLVELVYLVEKGVVSRSRFDQLLAMLDGVNKSYAVTPLSQDVARTMIETVPWSAVPELADRIIAATAVALNLPLLSKDARHQNSTVVETIW
jgi:predicted nucleic acid-binding protein